MTTTPTTTGPTPTPTTPAASAAAAAVSPLRTWIEIAAVILAIVLGVYAWHTWLAEHDARIRAEEQVKAAQANFTQASTQIVDLQKKAADVQAQASSQVAAIAKAAEAASTAPQIVKWLPSQVPLPQPIALQTPPATAQNPSPPQIAAIPAADLPEMKDFIVQAKQCAVELPAAQAGLTSCQAQAKLAAQQLADVEKERDAYKLELKGGTFWHRVKHDAKVLGTGALLGLAAACATGHCK